MSDSCLEPARSEGSPPRSEAGSALLAVLGAAAVLAALGLATVTYARGALDRAATQEASAQARFLAVSGIEAALHEISLRPGSRQVPARGIQRLEYDFDGGSADVLAIAEAGKANVNRASAAGLAALLAEAGMSGADARATARRIVAYRAALRAGQPRMFAPRANRRRESSFQPRGASIQMIEELLSVRGITAETLYGRYVPRRAASGAVQGLDRAGGLLRFLRTRGPAAVDVNAAPREVLAAAGLGNPMVDRIVAAREQAAIPVSSALLARAAGQAQRLPLTAGGEGSGRMLVSTARLAGGRAARTVTAVVRSAAGGAGLRVARWYEGAL